MAAGHRSRLGPAGWARVGLAVVAGTLAPLAWGELPAPAEPTSWVASFERAQQAFAGGRITPAAQALREALEAASQAGETLARADLALKGGTWCLRAHAPCLPDFQERSLEALQALAAEPRLHAQALPRLLALNILMLRTSLWLDPGRSHADIAGRIQRWLDGAPLHQVPAGAALRVDAHLALAESLARDRDRPQALRQAEIAWGNFLVSRQIAGEDQLHFLGRFIGLYNRLQQGTRAYRLSFVAQAYVRGIGRASLYDSLRLLQVANAARGSTHASDPADLQLQEEVLGMVELNDWTQRALQHDLWAETVVTCTWRRAPGCEVLHERLDRRTAQIAASPDRPLDAWSSGLVLAGAWWDLYRGQPIAAHRRELLGHPGYARSWDEPSLRAIYVGLAQAFLAAPDMVAAGPPLRQAVDGLLAMLREEALTDPLELPLAGQVRGLALTLGLLVPGAQAGGALLPPEQQFEVIELLRRSRRDVDSQFIHALAQTRGRGEAAALQAFSGQQQDWRRFEVASLARRLDELRAGSYAKAPAATSLLAEYDAHIQAVEAWARRPATPAQATQPPLHQLQQALRTGERYLTYFVAGGQLVGMCVGPERSWSARNALDSQALDRSVRNLRNFLSLESPPDEAIDARFPVADMQRLTAALLAPLQECLAGAEHLFLHLGDEFDGISPQALFDPRQPLAQDAPVAALPWLGRALSVARVGGAHHLVASRQRSNGAVARPAALAGGAFIGVGDPVLRGPDGPADPRWQVALRGVRRGGQPVTRLDNLPETREELVRLGQALELPATLLLGGQARELAVRQLPLRTARVLSFATHGLVREELPGLREAALAFTPGPPGQPQDDGLLTASDIARLDLDADLVILSACNSGRFDADLFGPEAASLSSAFFLAGARATLATLWSVESAVTAELVARYGARLRRPGASAASAWQATLQDFLADPAIDARWKNPRFWSAFVLFGDAARPLDWPAPQAAAIAPEPAPRGHLGVGGGVALGDGTRVVSGAEYVAGRDLATGTLNGFDATGRRLWTVREPDRGLAIVREAGPPAASVEVLAFGLGEAGGAPLEWRRYGADGSLQARRALPVAPLGWVGDAAALGPHLLVLRQAVAQGTVRLTVFDRASGRALADHGLRDREDSEQVRLRRSVDGWVVLRVGTRVRPAPLRWEADRLGLATPCLMAERSELVYFSADGLRRLESQEHSDLRLVDYAWHGGAEWLLYARHDPCNGRPLEMGVLTRTTPQGEARAQPLQGMPVRVTPHRLVAVDGRLLFTGSVTRSTRTPEAVDAKPGDPQPYDPTGSAPINARQRHGFALGIIGAGGEPLLLDTAFAGVDQFADTVLPSAQGLLVFGNTGDRQLVLPMRGPD